MTLQFFVEFESLLIRGLDAFEESGLRPGSRGPAFFVTFVFLGVWASCVVGFSLFSGKGSKG